MPSGMPRISLSTMADSLRRSTSFLSFSLSSANAGSAITIARAATQNLLFIHAPISGFVWTEAAYAAPPQHDLLRRENLNWFAEARTTAMKGSAGARSKDLPTVHATNGRGARGEEPSTQRSRRHHAPSEAEGGLQFDFATGGRT